VTAGHFIDDHKISLARFQSGVEVFVWGYDLITGALWHLDENTAVESRGFVNDRIVCPVPGCRARLTTAHRSKKRDGLQHYASTGGHSRESLFHAQGCALIESWLHEIYPRSRVRREEYSNAEGERRADVLITGTQGDRIAFEVQYSPLTPDQWLERHDSYRRQGIIDVWLFGHSQKQLKVDAAGHVKPSPTHEAVVASGSPLLFINPAERMIGVTVGSARRFDAELDACSGDTVQVWRDLAPGTLELKRLEEFAVSKARGIGGEWLDALHERTAEIHEHNERERSRSVEVKKRRQREAEDKQAAWELRRAPQQQRIRELFDEVERWTTSEALAAAKEYFGQYLKERISIVDNGPRRPPFLTRWQTVIYFDLVAGCTTPFGTRDAYNAIIARGVKMANTDAFKAVARYLYELESMDFVRRVPGYSKYPSFRPTTSGAWW
jgi:hypothetical protein